MPGLGGFEQMRRLTGIHNDHAFRMIDDPRIRGQPFCPVLVAEYRETSSQSASAPFDLRSLDADRAGLNCEDLHAASTIERTRSGRSKWTMWPALGTRT